MASKETKYTKAAQKLQAMSDLPFIIPEYRFALTMGAKALEVLEAIEAIDEVALDAQLHARLNEMNEATR